MKRWMTNLGVLQFFFALLLVIVIMFVSNFIVYRNSISDIYDRMSENNALAVQSVIKSIDNSFESINHVIHAIHSLPYNNLYNQDGTLDMDRVYTLQGQIQTIASASNLIEEVVVFYDAVPLAITTKGTSSLEHLFGRKYRHDLYDMNYWRNFMRTRHDLKVFPVENYTVLSDTTNEYKTMPLMAVVGGNKVSLSSKHILVFVNAEKLLQQVNQASVIPGASLIVLDANRNRLFSTGADLDLMEVLQEVYFNDVEDASLTREDYEYHVYQSDYNGFLYIERLPYRFRNITSVTQANHTIMITAIVSAVLLSVLLSLYLYRPIRRILRLLGRGTGMGSDFRKIESGIVRLQTENDAYRRQLAAVDASVRRSLFMQALDGAIHAEEYEEKFRKLAEDLFGERHFLLASMEFVPPAAQEDPLPVESIAALLQEQLEHEALRAAVFHEAGSRFLLLVGVEAANERRKAIQRLRRAAAVLEKDAFRGWKLRGCVGKLYAADLSLLKQAYEDVRFGRLYRPVESRETVVDTEEIRFNTNLHVPHERMEKLANCLTAGKLPEASAIIRETLRENANRRVHRHHLDHAAEAIFYTILRLSEWTDLDAKSLLQMEREFHRRMEAARDIEEIEQALIEAAEQIAERCRQEPRSKLNPVFLSQYIDLHYMENLYLDHMAEIVNTTPKYFSNYFKKTFGVNFVDYLNRVRLAHARELLKDTNLTIAEISERTGYLNASTFTTTFKKYFGISPSDYRKQLGA